MEGEPDNVTYIDEHRRERWLARLERARKMGEVLILNGIVQEGHVADVIPFPQKQPEDPGDPAA
jgi:hypothetical protein